MSAREAVLALDQGSSSSRVLVFDSRGRVLARAQRPVRLLRPREGWAEHDPRELVGSLEGALDEVLARLPRSVEIVGAGLACQRSTVAFWDRETLRLVSRAPSWMDGRASGAIAGLRSLRAEIHQRTGLYLTPYYSAPKMRWFIDHDPKVRALADSGRLRAGPLTSLIAARLTRGDADAADPTMAQRTLLLGLDSLDWDMKLLRAFGLERGWLPGLRPTCGSWGVIERGGRRIPLLACVGDQQAAAVGLGADAPGAAVANYGTGAFLLVHVGARARRVPGLLTSIGARPRGGAPAFLLEGPVHAAGTSFDWLARLGLMKDPGRVDEAFARSRRRVFALPALGGLGAPHWEPEAKAAWWGLTAGTSAADLTRAVAEGLCFLVADVADAARAGGAALRCVRAAGGLARSERLMAFQADLLGVALERRRESEATALGAAALAAGAVGRPWANALTAAAVERTFRPRLSRSAAARLRADWSKFAGAQRRLSRAIKLS